eukprot:m.145957 g.145957  ORF g.145957 m.145957 type:complete len:92 (-) comp52696_c0_seq14:543-818(-)
MHHCMKDTEITFNPFTSSQDVWARYHLLSDIPEALIALSSSAPQSAIQHIGQTIPYQSPAKQRTRECTAVFAVLRLASSARRLPFATRSCK